MTPSEKYECLKKLISSDGWGLVVSRLEDEISGHMRNMTENRLVDSHEMDFRRGAIYAMYRLMDLPQELKTMAESEWLLSLSEEERADMRARSEKQANSNRRSRLKKDKE